MFKGYEACPRKKRRRKNPRSCPSVRAKWQRPVYPEEKSFLARRPLVYPGLKGHRGLDTFLESGRFPVEVVNLASSKEKGPGRPPHWEMVFWWTRKLLAHRT